MLTWSTITTSWARLMAAPSSGRGAARARSAEGSDVELEAEHGEDADHEQSERDEEGHRRGEVALPVDQPLRLHFRAQLPQPVHELQLVRDADDEHSDPEPHER